MMVSWWRQSRTLSWGKMVLMDLEAGDWVMKDSIMSLVAVVSTIMVLDLSWTGEMRLRADTFLESWLRNS